MGLLLSVLVGCVGVLELLTCLRHASDGLVITINPPTPCLSYHEPAANDMQSIHDSLCSFSHSADLRLPRGAKHKLENLHEYSLRMRSELRTLDKNFDYSTLSEYSAGYLLGYSRSDSRLSPDSRISPDSRPSPDLRYSPDDLNYFVQEDETWIVHVERQSDEEVHGYDENEYIKTKNSLKELNAELRESLQQVACSLVPPEPEKYVRIPTPIPFDLHEEARRASSSEVDTESFDKDSGNEAPTTRSFEGLPIIKKDSRSASSVDESDHEERQITRKVPRKSPSKPQDFSRKPKSNGVLKKVERSPDNLPSRIIDSSTEVGHETAKKISQRKPKSGKSSTTIVRKPTRLKSRNAEVSRSAENLNAKVASKKKRDPERRKSDISVQTVRNLLRDMSTNTSPTSSPPLSRSDSKKSVSVEVQTTLEDALLDDETAEELGYSVLGLSESKKDLFSRDNPAKKSFKSKRFRSGSRDDQERQTVHAPSNVDSPSVEISRNDSILSERKSKEPNGWRRREDSRSKPSFEVEEDDDDDFTDAEDLIFSGEYTKAMNKDWHSGHFCCWQCDESLTGQRYVLRDEHPYCIKCYESVFANGCEECNKIIGIDSKDLSYKDKHWHEACFLCNRCRVSLVDKQFGSKVDKIYCGNCYDAQFASRCDGCGEIFRAGTKKMEYKTRQWHEKCFCCVVCKNPIGTKSFIPREQEIYCAGCYEDKFATRCVKCNKIITSGGVTYKNEPWHRDCFTCSNCNNSLAGQRFTSRDDKPYCADCFGELFAKRCTACSKPITGIGGTRFISFEDRHWHNDCFICAGCKTSLVGRGFITDGDDIICPECAKMKLM
ncbi:paxillin isoform X3 [Odontomachus brunneus]|uniref:paxillin isoform X3 n=1 Tax=Odontomachus brunneus TaxID=486640 RepID=UPI0013F28F36|nr:paxillin isoform X3 [Odontomachus brunneus]